MNNLLAALQEKFLNVFEDVTLYKEISFLDLKYLGKVLNEDPVGISLKHLCEINHLDDHESVVSELYDFVAEYESHNTSLHNTCISLLRKEFDQNEENSIDDEDEFLPLYLDSADDLDDTNSGVEIPTVNNSDFLTTEKCYCVHCILKIVQYVNIYTLYKYVALLPCTETKCERDFSYLKIIKNNRRSLLTQKNLESLMIICLEPDLFKNIDLNDIIDELAYSSKTLANKLL